jgi:hypothetical protein
VAERLLSLSNVLLYGRVLDDLQIQYRSPNDEPVSDVADRTPPRLGGNNFLENQLESNKTDYTKMAYLARIYAFSFEGHYYDLPKPSIFLVHGRGTLVEGPLPSGEIRDQRFSRAPSSADRTGLGSQYGSFANDIRVWSYDKGDFSIRLDSSTGTLDQILLEAELSGDRLRPQIAGAAVRSRPGRRGSDEMM